MRHRRLTLRMTTISDSLKVFDRDWAISWGIKFDGTGSAETLSNLSTNIYQALESIRWLHKSSQEMVDTGDRLSTVICTATSIANPPPHRREPLVCQEMADIIHRIRLNHHMLAYIERMLESQFQPYHSLLANQEAKATGRIAVAGQRDSLSMKTVSYLTMVFLPATFVSAVFSTSAFDFQNWNNLQGQNSGVASPGWWICLVCCALTAIVTIGIWFGWHRDDLRRWGRMSRNLV